MDYEDLWLALRTLAGLAGVFAFLRWYEPRMLYYPQHPTRAVDPAPPGVEEVWLTTDDGVRLHAWRFPAPQPTDRALLFCHGNAGNVSHRREKAQRLAGLGVEVLVFDYRGYGRSEGRPSEAGTYRDAEAGRRFLLERGATPERLFVYGESLGTGVAVELAARHRVAGLILEAGFTSVPDVAQRIFWFLPVRWLVRNRYENRRKLPRVADPVLILHSPEDRVFSLRHARALLRAAPKAELVEIAGPHGEPTGDAYRSALAAFVAPFSDRRSAR